MLVFSCRVMTLGRGLDRPWVAWLALLALGLTAPAHASSDFCHGAAADGPDRAPGAAHVGLYVNRAYGYAVRIPQGWTAYGDPSGPERGVRIALARSSRVYLRVDAAYDAFYDITAEGVHARDRNAIRLHDTLLGEEGTSASLAQTPGRRYVMRVQCAGDPQTYIHDVVIAVRRREIYRLHLCSLPERYAADRKLLNAMLRSWRWEAIR